MSMDSFPLQCDHCFDRFAICISDKCSLLCGHCRHQLLEFDEDSYNMKTCVLEQDNYIIECPSCYAKHRDYSDFLVSPGSVICCNKCSDNNVDLIPIQCMLEILQDELDTLKQQFAIKEITRRLLPLRLTGIWEREFTMAQQYAVRDAGMINKLETLRIVKTDPTFYCKLVTELYYGPKVGTRRILAYFVYLCIILERNLDTYLRGRINSGLVEHLMAIDESDEASDLRVSLKIQGQHPIEIDFADKYEVDDLVGSRISSLLDRFGISEQK